MEKSYYKAIILVLASESELYNELKEIYKKYKDLEPSIKVYFVYSGQVSFVPEDCDLVYSDLKETVLQPHPAKKVVRALEHINKVHNYDYLIRTNLSTFWVFDRLLKRLNTLPTSNVLTGRPGFVRPLYVVGSDMVVSKDLVDKLLTDKYKAYIPYEGKYIPEDRILSEFFTGECGVEILADEKHFVAIETWTEFDKLELYCKIFKNTNADHYRAKNYKNRSVDIHIHKELLKHYYGKV